MKRNRQKWLVVLFITFVARLCYAANPECVHDGSPSLTTTSILANLKTASTQDRFIDPNFFSETSLAAFFCASRFRWNSNDERRTVEIGGFASLYELPITYPGTTIYAFLNFGDGKAVVPEAHLIIPHLDSRLTAAELLKIYGADYTLQDTYPSHSPINSMDHGVFISPATSEFGNKTIMYELHGQHSTTTLYAAIRSDGIINKIVLIQKGIK